MAERCSFSESLRASARHGHEALAGVRAGAPPEPLILDEPTVGLNPLAREDVLFASDWFAAVKQLAVGNPDLALPLMAGTATVVVLALYAASAALAAKLYQAREF